ncbi:MAG: alpha/beta hydrolase [Candidatus Promineifilaceae bacterium]
MDTVERVIVLEDGRKLHVCEAGRPDGVPVLVLHGTPGSNLVLTKWVEDAQSRGIRLISYDRPGYGGSTRDPGRSVASAAEDVAAIARQLDLERLGVWGFSGGGPHSLACAALLPDLVAAAGVIASPTPYQADGVDWFAGMGEDNIVEFGAALDGEDALRAFIEGQVPGLLETDTKVIMEAFGTLLSPVDAAVLTEENAGFLLRHMQMGIKDGGDGWIDDDLAFVKPWGFDLSGIEVPVLLLHGAHDKFVPFSHGEWLAGHTGNVEARLSAEDGHLTLVVDGASEVHGWLLSNLS